MRSARTATPPGRGCAATAEDEPYECHRDDPDLHKAAAMKESAGSTKQSMTMVTHSKQTRNNNESDEGQNDDGSQDDRGQATRMMRIRVCRLDKCQEDEPDEPRRQTTKADDHEGHHDANS